MTDIKNVTKEVFTKLFGRCKFQWILPERKKNCSGRKSIGDSTCETCPFFVTQDQWTERTY